MCTVNGSNQQTISAWEHGTRETRKKTINPKEESLEIVESTLWLQVFIMHQGWDTAKWLQSSQVHL